MIALSVNDNTRRDFIVFGDEPFRCSTVLDPTATTFVYEGVNAEEETPQWEPAFCYDGDVAEEDGGNRSLVSYRKLEIAYLRSHSHYTVFAILEGQGLSTRVARAVGAMVLDPKLDKKHWNKDCQRYVYSYDGPLTGPSSEDVRTEADFDEDAAVKQKRRGGR
jgi:hypothetical protein